MASEPSHPGASASAEYTIIGESSFLHRMYDTLHRFGLQSNVIVSARYSVPHASNNLSRPAVYSALRSIIGDYPDLAVVGVIVPSKKPGRHSLKRALLHNINLESCTEFIDVKEDGVGAELLEKLHNEWSWTIVEPGKPWWKVVIVNGRDVVFVFHHLVCDGRFGLIFHREFLAALNSTSSSSLLSGSLPVPAPVIKIDPATAQTAPDIIDVVDAKPSILFAMFEALFMYLLRFWFGKKMFFNDLPPPQPFPESATAIVDPSQRTVMRVKSYRIPASKMAAILAACRSRKTTFTPLMMVLIGIVLANEHYPDAKLGFLRCAADIRSLLKPFPTENGAKDPMNGASGIIQAETLGKYRRAVTPATTGQKNDSGINGFIDIQAAWKLVQRSGKNLRKSLEGRHPYVISSLLQGYLLGSDLEDMLQTAFPSLALHLGNAFLVSNLGPFSCNPENIGDGWRVEDVQFSASPANGRAGYRGIIFNVAGMKGGDTVVNATFEDGVIDPQMVEEVLKSVMAKIDCMAGDSLST